MGIDIHSDEDINAMRLAGKLASDILSFIGSHVKEGVSTDYLNSLIHDYTRDHGAESAPLGYHGFTKSACFSPNNVICHGGTKDYILKNGDILNIDVTPKLNGWHGDSSKMFFVGEPSIKAKRVCDVSYNAMMKGIEIIRPGIHTGDIGNAIESYVKKFNYSVVREYTGHGTGKIFHTEPTIFNFGIPGTGTELKEGMIFTIEPMVNIGKADTKLLDDGWTVVTKDRSLSAQYEHTVVVLKDGYEILTL